MADTHLVPAELPFERYRVAEQLLERQWKANVADAVVSPHWIDDGARFTFRTDRTDGPAFLLVDPQRGTREPAFDHDRLAAALAETSGSAVDPGDLPFKRIGIEDDTVSFTAFDRHFECRLADYSVREVEAPASPDPMESHSPDGRWSAYLDDHDLWLRQGADGDPRRLTTDGTGDNGYGVQPDNLGYGVLMQKFGLPSLPPLVSWSKDSRYLLTHRTDQRDVALSHLVEAAPADGGRSRLHTYHFAMPGEEHAPSAQLVVFEAATGEEVPVKAEPLFMPMLSPVLFNWLWWDAEQPVAYYLEQPRDLQTLWLRAVDARTGEVRTLVEESGSPRVEPGQVMGQRMVHVLTGGDEVVWYSQHDGWGHLYRYDAGDSQGHQLTSGDWAVQQILHVDESDRVVYFLASGMVPEDPYRRQVCRVGLDGTGFARLTDDDRDHLVTVAPGGAYFLDSASTRQQPPVITARAWDGSVLVEVASTDVSALEDLGWRPPESFRATAADGTTDVYGVLYLPHDFDPSRSYPVIDHPYPGPQHGRYLPQFGGVHHLDREAEAIASLGFVVVAMDGRGLPGRSRAFHDISYGNYDTAGFLEDHVAALRELAGTRPWLDLDRVGIFGDSGGGYATVRGMLHFPEFYKVGVSSCGNHDQRYYQLSWGETYDGPLDDELYSRTSNVDLADRLQGKLLLIHGEMDDNVHPQLTLRLVDRLVALDKDFDMLIVPGAEHLFIGYDAFVKRRRWDYLVRHLLRLEPPAGFRLTPTPVDASVFFDAVG
jgi:dipeptidyl-peptidase-4